MRQFSKEVSTVESVKFAKNIVDNQGDIVVAASSPDDVQAGETQGERGYATFPLGAVAVQEVAVKNAAQVSAMRPDGSVAVAAIALV